MWRCLLIVDRVVHSLVCEELIISRQLQPELHRLVGNKPVGWQQTVPLDVSFMETGRTRSGKAFRPLESPWDNTTNLLLTVSCCCDGQLCCDVTCGVLGSAHVLCLSISFHSVLKPTQVLPSYLDHSSLLKGRLVCQAWCTSFSSHVSKLQLQQPASAYAARRLVRRVAGRFDGISTLHVTLLEDPVSTWDFTGDEDQPQLCVPGEQQRNSAAVVLMKELGAMGTFQELQVVKPVDSECRCLPALLQPMPQLRVLDLSQCAHEPSDLLVIAQNMPQLQQLLLHCPCFTTLSGRRVRHGDYMWQRHGGNTRYQAEHMAALAQLPCLQHLECASPVSLTTQEIRTCECMGAVASA